VSLTRSGIAIVTGGSSGIGLATARKLLNRGFHVHLWARREAAGAAAAEALNQLGAAGRASFHSCDVSSWPSVQRAADAFTQRHDRLDVLVNSAGLLRRGSLMSRDGAPAFDQVGVLLGGTIATTTALSQALRAAGSAVVINIGSVAGRQPFASLGAYGAAKAGVVHFTRVAAKELYPHGVRVLCVCPGVVDTPLMPPSELRALRSALPSGRLQSAEEVADLVVALTSGEFAAMTGAVIDFDDGVGLFPGERVPTQAGSREMADDSPRARAPSGSTAPAADGGGNGARPHPAPPAPPRAVDQALLERVKTVFGEVFAMNRDAIDFDVAPERVPRWDSIGHLRLVAGLEDAFHCTLDVSDVMDLTSFGKVVAVIERKAADKGGE